MDEERVHRVIQHYETQSEAHSVAEEEAAYEHDTLIEVPAELVPAVRELITKHQQKNSG